MAEENDYGLSAQELADFESAKNLYSRFGLGSEEERSAQFEEQKSMTRANILFDLAQAGLIIAATPPTKGESPAATLARAAASSEFFPKVGARSAELQKTKTAMDAQERQMDMMAVQRMQQLQDVRDTRAYEKELAGIKTKPKDKEWYSVTVQLENGETDTIQLDMNSAEGAKKYEALESAGVVISFYKVGTKPSETSTTKKQRILRLPQEVVDQLNASVGEDVYSPEMIVDINDKTVMKTIQALQIKYPNQVELTEVEEKPPEYVSVIAENGTEVLGTYNINNIEEARAMGVTLSKNTGSYKGTPREDKTPEYKNVIASDGVTVLGNFNINDPDKVKEMETLLSKNTGAYMGTPNKKDRNIKTIIDQNGNRMHTIDISTEEGLNDFMEILDKNPTWVEGTPEIISDSDVFSKFGFLSKDELQTFKKENPDMFAYMQGQSRLMDEHYMAKFGLTKDEFMNLDDATKRHLRKLDPNTVTKILNGQIIDITDPNKPKVIFGEPTVKTLTLDGEVLDITDTNNIKVIYGDPDRDIRILEGQLVEINEEGEPVPIFGDKTPKQGIFENIILRDGTSHIYKKVGDKLYDINGDEIDLASEKYAGALLVSKNTAYENATLAAEKARFRARHLQIEQELGEVFILNQLEKIISGNSDEKWENPEFITGNNVLPELELNENDKVVLFDAIEAVKKGTGFGPTLKNYIGEILGGIAPEKFGKMFAATQDAKNFIYSLYVLGRIAMANSPKVAEGEQVRLARLFPDPDKFLTNPYNNIAKLRLLKKEMIVTESRVTKILATESNSSVRTRLKNQMYAIQGVLRMLETVPLHGTVSNEGFQDFVKEMDRMRENN